MALIQEIIRKKRDGGALDAEAITAFVAALTDGSASEGQVAALAMAVFLNGMDEDETVRLTLAMRDSGDVLSWAGLDRPVVDKHSTGGVGDNVSLMLAPIAAAAGLAVPMISGRGLGHTGGTLDKMDAIPGYRTGPSNDLFVEAVRTAGCAIIGQTGDLAPADRRFYAVRDVTATVESIPLITASILSKKLAAGLDALVLDVKSGNGAFMAEEARAVALAETLVGVASGAGLRAAALITDMNEPLADAAGNAVEVRHAVDFLTGKRRQPRMADVVLSLAAEMLLAGGLETGRKAARVRAEAVLDDGSAAERFAQMVAVLGGPPDFVDAPDRHLAGAPVEHAVTAGMAGHLAACRTRDLGLAVVALGGGRRRPEDSVDPAVGLTGLLPLGSSVAADSVIATVHARDEAGALAAANTVRQAYDIAEEPGGAGPAVIRRIG